MASLCCAYNFGHPVMDVMQHSVVDSGAPEAAPPSHLASCGWQHVHALR